MNKGLSYAYFPGCSAHSTARDMHESSLAVARVLGIELSELKGWTCCGATAAHQTDRILAVSLSAANLALAQKEGKDVVVNCAACFNRFKTANYEVKNDPEVREQVAKVLGYEYDGSVRVRHFTEVLLQDVGISKLKKAVKQPLYGLKVACYYGCYLVRPPEVTQFDDPENPVSLETIAGITGAETMEWAGKVDCCGGGLNLSRTDITIERSKAVIDMAIEAGAECIAVACPMCQASLDLRQLDITKKTGTVYNVPIIYITQLLGLSYGISPKELGFERLMISPEKVLKSISAR
jgi:heterodisulfide reductase subunit B2